MTIGSNSNVQHARMHSTRGRHATLLVVLMIALAFIGLSSEAVAATKKAKIIVKDRPANDGTMEFFFCNEGSAPDPVTVNVKERWTPETVAEEIATQFYYLLGDRSYYIYIVNKSTIVIEKRRRKTPKFDIEKSSQNVRKLSVVVKY